MARTTLRLLPFAIAGAALLAGCDLAATPTHEAAADSVAAPTAVADAAADPAHEHCHKEQRASPFERSTAAYTVPDITLLDQAGQPFSIDELAASDRPVALNFIFATCTTICPVMSATFSKARAELGPDADRVTFVSVTIDPEHDTPEVLASYAERFDAPPEWAFLTGPPNQVEQVLRGFDAWTGTKFDHRPITLLHAPGSADWIRLEGLGSGSVLADEVRGLLEAPGVQ